VRARLAGAVLKAVSAAVLLVHSSLLFATGDSVDVFLRLGQSYPDSGMSGHDDRAPQHLHIAQAGTAGSGSSDPGDSLRFEIRSFAAEGNTLLGSPEINRVLDQFTGPRRDFGDVQRALEALQKLYQEKGYGGVQVTLPEQELNRGVVTFNVVEPKIGRVLVEGNKHFSADNARRSVPSLVTKTTPMMNVIAASIKVVNENPAKQSTVLLRQSEKAGEVDAVIRMADVSPVRFSLTLDNTGNKETGDYRSTFAFQHANLFDRDHVLTLQYITSPQNFNDVEVYGLGYRIPLYDRGDSIDLVAGYSTANSGTVQNLFDVSGQGAVYAIRYNHNFRKIGDLDHRFVYGMDYRAYQNLVTPVGSQVNIVPDITVHPVSMIYSGQMRQVGNDIGFYFGFWRNLAGGNDGRQSNFQASRQSAKADYLIWRLGGNYVTATQSGWQFRAKFDAQYSKDALIAAEQFGLGGAESIRGFNERYTSNDKGYRSTWEIYTPETGTIFGLDKARARFLMFYDTGHLTRNHPQPGDLATVSLDSVGVGFRMSYGTNFTLKSEFAKVKHDGNLYGNRPKSRWHVTASYIF